MKIPKGKMKNKRSLTRCCVLISFVLYAVHSLTNAQPVPFECGFEFGRFNDSSRVFLFEDKVPLRSGPGASEGIISYAKIGTPALILSGCKAPTTQSDARNYWYRLVFIRNDSTFDGFVWGGHIAMLAQRLTSANRTDLLLYGIPEWDPEKGFSSTAKVLRNGQLISKLDFAPIAAGFFDAGIFGHSVCADLDFAHGFSGIASIVRLIFEYPACGYENGEIFLLWSGEKLSYLAKASKISEAGAFRYTYQLVFPDQDGGESNTLIIRQEMTEYEWRDEQEFITRAEMNIRRFHWDGESVLELPEEIKKIQP